MSSTKTILLESSSSPMKSEVREVKIRSYQNRDFESCREIFTQGMEQLVGRATRVVLPKYCGVLVALSVLVILAAVKWTSWMLAYYVFFCVVLLALLYIYIYIECWRFIKECLATDLYNIEKTYMSGDGSHMWVAEFDGKVVGMVGLVVYNHKPGVAELQRMSVSPVCRRMGIAKKLLDELLQHAKEQRFDKLVLTTTSAQTPAIRLYKKWGFRLIDVFPYPQKILADLQYLCFGLEL
ncbi:N-acetyltransferase 8-like [Montipora foliosa]|uniref:N-acetyltransferase 8-like n=1 Tax=Montipora foliosa TaxID=591990 RepID=UPI0035F1DBD2